MATSASAMSGAEAAGQPGAGKWVVADGEERGATWRGQCYNLSSGEKLGDLAARESSSRFGKQAVLPLNYFSQMDSRSRRMMR